MEAKTCAAYYPSWAIYARNTQPRALRGYCPHLTHLIYAFFKFDQAGRLTAGDVWADTTYASAEHDGSTAKGNLGQLADLKRQFPHLKVGLAIGGWAFSHTFRFTAATPQRDVPVRSILELVQMYAFDFVDIDWEYPENAADARQLALLIEDLDKALQSSHRFITMAIPANLAERLVSDKCCWPSMALLARHVSLFFAMSYDYSGPWSSTFAHHAPLHRSRLAAKGISDHIKALLSAGMPRNKLVLGIPCYGRAFYDTDGPGCVFVPRNNDTETVLARDFPFDGDSKLVSWDADAMANIYYDPTKRMGLSYESMRSLQAKLDFVTESDLGGVFFWELAACRDAAHADNVVSLSHRHLERHVLQPRRRP